MTPRISKSFTRIVDTSKEIKEQVNNFGKDECEILLRSLLWIRDNIETNRYISTSEKMCEWRKRPATEIFESGYVNGCTDYAILFCSFMRTAKIPCMYVEAIRRKTLEELKAGHFNETFEGHVFCRVIIDGNSFLVDATNQQIFTFDNIPQNVYVANHFILTEGLDYEEIGLTTVDRIKDYAKQKIKEGKLG